jgi:hypothetical protein
MRWCIVMKLDLDQKRTTDSIYCPIFSDKSHFVVVAKHDFIVIQCGTAILVVQWSIGPIIQSPIMLQ